MTLSVGLDFGTSNSSVAVLNNDKLTLVPLDPAAEEPAVLRSLLYLSRDGDRVVGQEAFDRHQRENTGRAVHLERRFVGDVTMTFAGVGTITKEAWALIDTNEPGRLFQSIKSLLPDRMFKQTNVFGVSLTAVDLIELLAGEILRRVEAYLGEPVRRLTVGRPVHFAGGEAGDTLAAARLQEAFMRLQVDSVTFLEEPVAAAISYARQRTVGAAEGVALIFDFGGGTLDITVIRTTQGTVEILATGGVAVGGDLLDRRLLEARMLQHFGDGAVYGAARLPIPRHVLARVLDWQTLYLLNRPESLELLDEIARGSSRPQEVANLRALVTHSYGGALARAVEQGKQRLSTARTTCIELNQPDLLVRQQISRDEFEGIIRDQHRAVLDCVIDTVQRAGIDPHAVQTVVTTGGSSRIPLFSSSLRDQYPQATLVEQDAFTSVAAGLALAGSGA